MLCRFAVRSRFHGYEDFVDSGRIHIHDLEVEIAPRKLFAGLRDMFQLFEDQPAERVVIEFVVQFLLVEEREEVVERDLSVDQITAVVAGDDVLRPLRASSLPAP